ncbi:MAG: DUF4190 domain-containing protein [Crocinitomicaceae bacterium]|nr:DUF4190 domain-containing protein [Crocinitomicaceae bacterium]
MSKQDDLLDPDFEENIGNFGQGQQLPNATATLVLGICSIVGCWLWGVPGLICGIIALSLHGKDKKMYATAPRKYETSFKNAKAGFVCAIIGTSLSAITFLFIVIALASGPGTMRF